jgi:hypothetical protein
VITHTYRVAWSRASTVVLAFGALVLAALWAVGSPWTFAAALALAWMAERLRWPALSVRCLRRCWQHQVGTALPEAWRVSLLVLLPAFLLAAVGWTMLLGGTGTVVVLIDALLGLPLIYPQDGPVPRSTTTAEMVERVGPGTVVDLVTASGGAGGVAAGLAQWSGPRTLLPALSDTELWHAWQESTRALRHDLTADARMRIVAARARYLDALIERDPGRIAAHFAADASGDWTSFDSPS